VPGIRFASDVTGGLGEPCPGSLGAAVPEAGGCAVSQAVEGGDAQRWPRALGSPGNTPSEADGLFPLLQRLGKVGLGEKRTPICRE